MKYLPYKHRNLNLNFWKQEKESGEDAKTCNPSAGEVVARIDLCSLDSQASLFGKTKANEKAQLKIQGEVNKTAQWM